jgi:alkylation response protein AidB-like acyl-CoA dehydrogenase
MDFDLGPEADALRERLRALIHEHIPDWFHSAFADDPQTHEVANAFCSVLARERLLTINWPEEYGGSNASIWDQAIVREEMWAHGEPRGAQYMGLSWVGPTIMRFGTDEQKRRHLSAIASGEAIWCQGFSEPEAGSDLASLQLRAERCPEGWKLSGQKIWTSYAGLANWCFLAARTSDGERKQDGITIFLVPMAADGITVRPIASMMGPHHVNEVFFDAVTVGDESVLGEVGRGWDVIVHVLSIERVGIPRYARSDRLLNRLADVIAAGDDLPAELESAYVDALVRCRIARLLAYRAVAESETSGDATAASIARIAATTLDQEVAELAAEVVGSDAVSTSRDVPLEGDVEDVWRYARSATVAAGTIEIQRMLVARRMAKDAAG